MALRLDGSRSVAIHLAKHPHLDHGNAVISHSAQEHTANRVLIHVGTESGAKDLLKPSMCPSHGAISVSPRHQYPLRVI